MNFLNDKNNNSHIISLYSLQCERCHKNIEVPIKASDKKKIAGGIFRIVAIHQCLNEPLAFILFFDGFLTLRQKVVTPVTVAGINEYDYFDDHQKENIKQISGFNYLYKKLQEDLAKVIFGIITGQRIVIIGEKFEVESTINSLKIFAYYPACRIIPWTKDTVENMDIIGTTRDNLNYYTNSVIVDLANNSVINGTMNSFCVNLVYKIINEPNFNSYTTFVSEALSDLVQLVDELIQVRDFDELESLLTSLALDGITEETIEIIVPLTARLNPLVAQYYRSNFTITEQPMQEILPLRMWEISNNIIAYQAKHIHDDVLLNHKERKIIQRLNKLLKESHNKISLYEYYTPLNHYILIPQSKNSFIFCFPRFYNDNVIITNAMRFQNHISQDSWLKEKFIENPVKILGDTWLTEMKNHDLPMKYNSLLGIRKSLPTIYVHSTLETFYFETHVSEMVLKEFTSILLEEINNEFKVDPKILHTTNLYTLSGTLKDLQPDNQNNNDKIDIKFALHLYVQSIDEKNTIELILDIFNTPKFCSLGLETQELFEAIYKKFLKIILSAIQHCT